MRIYQKGGGKNPRTLKDARGLARGRGTTKLDVQEIYTYLSEARRRTLVYVQLKTLSQELEEWTPKVSFSVIGPESRLHIYIRWGEFNIRQESVAQFTASGNMNEKMVEIMREQIETMIIGFCHEVAAGKVVKEKDNGN